MNKKIKRLWIYIMEWVVVFCLLYIFAKYINLGFFSPKEIIETEALPISFLSDEVICNVGLNVVDEYIIDNDTINADVITISGYNVIKLVPGTAVDVLTVPSGRLIDLSFQLIDEFVGKSDGLIVNVFLGRNGKTNNYTCRLESDGSEKTLEIDLGEEFECETEICIWISDSEENSTYGDVIYITKFEME